MSRPRTALVIGGGVAGPVTATALRMAGVDAIVCEAYPGPADGIGGALALAPNGLAALQIIGAEKRVRAHATPASTLRMRVGNRDLGALPTLADLPPLQLIDRADLHRALHDHAIESGVTFRYNKRLLHVDDTDHSLVTAHFADGSTETADVLVGTDGIHSTVRSLIDPDAPGPRYTGMLGFAGTADIESPDAPGTMTFAFGKRAYYLYWTLPDGRVEWGANLPHPEYLRLNQAREIPSAAWLRILRDTYLGDVPGEQLANSTDPESLLVAGALHIMPPVPRWHRGRMALVGDSVHAPSNSTGQGASLAIEGAVELARCLRDLPNPATAFATYEALRRPRVEAIAARGAKLNRTKTPGPVARALMPILMPLMLNTVMKPERAMAPEQRHTINWDEAPSYPPHRKLNPTSG